jgi:thymidylate kinase
MAPTGVYLDICDRFSDLSMAYQGLGTRRALASLSGVWFVTAN